MQMCRYISRYLGRYLRRAMDTFCTQLVVNKVATCFASCCIDYTQTNLQVYDDLAHGITQEPSLEDRLSKAGRQTNEDGEEVCHGQVRKEEVGDGPQVFVSPDSVTHKEIASNASDEHQKVDRRDDPFQGGHLQVHMDVLDKILGKRQQS